MHPISFEEPFGLSVAEAMLFGTLVIAFNRGSIMEIIIEGETGLVVHGRDEAMINLQNVKYINRKYCSEWAVSKFSSQKMIERYLKVHEKILIS